MNYSAATRLFFALAALPFALAACEATGDEETLQIQSAEQELPQAPPEAIPMIQDPQTQIWIPGYWAPSGNGFAWVCGKIVPRPDPTAVWSKAHWVPHTYGWTFTQGHWE